MIFGLFLVISTILWLLTTLNKDYVEQLKYPVKFTNIPKSYQGKTDLPENLKLEVSGHGYNILSYKINYSKPPIIINLKEINPRKSRNGQVFILGKDLEQLADNRIKGEIMLNKVRPDTIFFIKQQTASKKVPVISQIDYSAADQHIIVAEAEITPDSILISGAPEIINSTDSVFTEQKSYKNITGETLRFVNLKKQNDIHYYPNKVQVSIIADKYTENSIKAPVTFNNLPDSLEVSSIPGKINIRFRVPVSKYKTIQPSDFRLIADFNAIRNGKAKVNLSIYPSWIEDIHLSQNEVQVILKNKQE